MVDQLSDGCILIRRYEYSDIDLLYEAVRESINEVSVWLPWCHPEYSKRETIEWITFQMDAWDNGREFAFAVIEKESGKFVGGSGLNLIDFNNKFANLGYWIRSGYTRHGYATRAAGLTAQFGFKYLNFNRIEIIMAAENAASKRIPEKLGAHCEGILRNRIVIHDVSHDAYLFSLIPSEVEL